MLDDQSAYAIAMAGVFLSMFAAGSIGSHFKLSNGWILVVLFALWAVVFVLCQLVFIHFGYGGLGSK